MLMIIFCPVLHRIFVVISSPVQCSVIAEVWFPSIHLSKFAWKTYAIAMAPLDPSAYAKLSLNILDSVYMQVEGLKNGEQNIFVVSMPCLGSFF